MDDEMSMKMTAGTMYIHWKWNGTISFHTLPECNKTYVFGQEWSIILSCPLLPLTSFLFDASQVCFRLRPWFQTLDYLTDSCIILLYLHISKRCFQNKNCRVKRYRFVSIGIGQIQSRSYYLTDGHIGRKGHKFAVQIKIHDHLISKTRIDQITLQQSRWIFQ